MTILYCLLPYEWSTVFWNHIAVLVGRHCFQAIQQQKCRHQRISSVKQNSQRQLWARVDQAAGRLVSSQFYFACLSDDSIVLRGIYCHLVTCTWNLTGVYILWQGKEPMGTEPSVHTNIRDDFTDSFKQWVAYGEALCHWIALSTFHFQQEQTLPSPYLWYFIHIWVLRWNHGEGTGIKIHGITYL